MEFFQLFRFVKHQERWALEILLILNGEPRDYKNYDMFRLYNFTRLTAQIKTFGISEHLFKYKFLFHYGSYWRCTINIEKSNRPSNALGKSVEFKKVFEPMKPGDVPMTYAYIDLLYRRLDLSQRRL